MLTVPIHQSARKRRCLPALLLLVLPLSTQAAERYVGTRVDAYGHLHLRTSAGSERQPKKQKDQVGLAAAAIAPDGATAGWLALYRNCCTSYPVALALVVYRDGRILHSFSGNGEAFSLWKFEAGGTQVAFEQETVHGHRGVHYELRDIGSGRLLEHYEGDPAPHAPRWVRDVTQ